MGVTQRGLRDLVHTSSSDEKTTMSTENHPPARAFLSVDNHVTRGFPQPPTARDSELGG